MERKLYSRYCYHPLYSPLPFDSLKCIVLRYKQLGEVNLTVDSGCFGNSLLLILALVRCFSCETLNFIIEKDKRLSETLFVFLPRLLSFN